MMVIPAKRNPFFCASRDLWLRESFHSFSLTATNPNKLNLHEKRQFQLLLGKFRTNQANPQHKHRRLVGCICVCFFEMLIPSSNDASFHLNMFFFLFWHVAFGGPASNNFIKQKKKLHVHHSLTSVPELARSRTYKVQCTPFVHTYTHRHHSTM